MQLMKLALPAWLTEPFQITEDSGNQDYKVQQKSSHMRAYNHLSTE